jgi:uncharacterized protein (DUF1800 family)
MKPYAPTDYSFSDAAHLLRRMGFGGTTADVERLRAMGPAAAVDALMRFSDDDGTTPNPHSLEERFKESLEGGNPPGNAAARTVPVAQAWWMHRLVHSTQPFKEKLTLFWHGHFVSGLDKVRNGFMLRAQNELFRRMGLSKFQDLVLAVAKDPAMLTYLDNDENTKAHPNENFARELMELFTMGVHGGYTERDVQESARAFTGWSYVKKRGDMESLTNPKFVFNPKNHDTGSKTFLGKTGAFKGEDIVGMVSTHPSTARFITAKLWRFFVSEDLPEATATELADLFTRTGGDLRAVLREVFTSAEFYAPQNRFALVKSPVEYVVGALRSSQTDLADAHTFALSGVLATMAQIPFYPPNVKGWDGGMDWIADTTVLNRLQFMGALSSGKLPTNYGPANGRNTRGDPDKTKTAASSWVIGKSLDETLELIGKTYLGAKPTGSLDAALRLYANGRNTPEVARGLAYLVMVSPQYHLA